MMDFLHLYPLITNENIALPEFETSIRKDRNSNGGRVIKYHKININIKRRLDSQEFQTYNMGL